MEEEDENNKHPTRVAAVAQIPPPPVVVMMMETSLVQEESIDESQTESVEDLQVTLQEKIEMRKNLESTFDCQTLSIVNNNNNMQRNMMSGTSNTSSSSSGLLSIQEKIFHFEQKVAAHRATATAAPPGRPPLGPLMASAEVNGSEAMMISKKTANKRLKVFLRLRPVQDGGPSTIEVLPPCTSSTTTAHNHHQQHQKQQALLYSTKIQTHPPKTSNAAKVDRSNSFSAASLRTLGGTGTSTSDTAAATTEVKKEYEFTRVFGPDASQHDVYTHTALPMVNQLCSGNTIGKSVLLFCYGITNAGKTHTILGDPKLSSKNDMHGHHQQRNESWGIVPRCLDGVLQKVNNTDLQVYLSFLEVYNEHIFDLLPHEKKQQQQNRHHHGHKRVGSSTSLASAVSNASTVVTTNDINTRNTSLKIRERRGQIIVQGLANHHVTSLQQGLALIRRAKVGRHTATNNLNQKSSRSHCVCRLTVKKKKTQGGAGGDNNDDDDDSCSVGSYRSSGTSHSNNYTNSAGSDGVDNINEEAHFWIVDLAGSERSKRTNMGRIRQQEAACINKSLMTLMRCLTMQSTTTNKTKKNNNCTLPYRDSKLTVLFMRHWNTINSQTSMIVNAHASIQDYDETQHVLGYAVSVKVVPTTLTTSAAIAADAASGTVVPVLPPPRVEYGYDGHRKKVGKQRSTIRKVAKILRKLSPVPKRNNNNKRPNSQLQQSMGPAVAAVLPLAPAQPFARSLLEQEQQQPVAKKIRRDAAENAHYKVAAAPPQQQQQEDVTQRGNQWSMAQYNRELTSLQMALSEARAKIQVLTSKVTGLEQQVEATETQVRAEVAEEMLNEMTAMRQRYEETISRLKELKKNTANSGPRPSLVQRNHVMEVEELQEMVEELEEDMERMAHHHEEELLSMQHEHAETLLLKDQEIGELKSRLAEMEEKQQQPQSLAAAAVATVDTSMTNRGDNNDVESLQQQLAASRKEVSRLQRSKEELIATYEQLLAGDDHDNSQNDDDDDNSDNDEDDDNEEEEVDGDPTPKMERTKLHRETLVQKKKMTTTTSTNETPSDEEADEEEEEEEEESEINEPTPKVDRNKNNVNKQPMEKDAEMDDSCPTPSARRRKPFGPVSANKKQVVTGNSTNKTINSSSTTTDSDSPTNTSSSIDIDIDDVSQKATIQEPFVE